MQPGMLKDDLPEKNRQYTLRRKDRDLEEERNLEPVLVHIHTAKDSENSHIMVLLAKREMNFPLYNKAWSSRAAQLILYNMSFDDT
jgi:hypothetical protein